MKILSLAAAFLSGFCAVAAEPLFDVNGKICRADVKGETLTLRAFMSRFQNLCSTAPNASAAKSEDTITIHIADHRTLTPEQKEALSSVKYPYGFLMRFNGKTFEILAKNARGTSYAWNQFLREFCGYRNFAGMGEFCIEKMPFRLPNEKWKKKYEPDLLSLTVAWGGDSGFDRNVRTLIFSTHSLFKVIPPEKYADSHPEYYPMINGQRKIPEKEGHGLYGMWQPCLMNPDLLRLVMEYAEDYFKQNPNNLSLPLGVNDGGGSCHCPGCEELKRKYNNQYIPFYNAVAKELAKTYPDKLLSFIAYGEAAAVPINIQLEPNILVEVANGLSGRLDAWRKAGARHFGTYEYYNTIGSGYVIPMYYPHTIGKQWKEAYKEYGIQSIWLELYPVSWIYASPRMYVLNTLAWDMDADIDTLLDEYFSAVYGPAGTYIRKLFDIFEKRCARNRFNDIHQIDEYTLEDVKQMDSLLEEASQVTLDKRQLKELDRLKLLYGFSRHYFQIAGALQKIRSATSAREVLQYAAMALENCDALDKFQMTQEESMSLFINSSGKPADRFKNLKEQSRLQPAFYVEEQIDRKIKEFTDALPENTDPEKYWEEQVKEVQNENLLSLIRSISYCRLSPDAQKNLLSNPSFEIRAPLKKKEPVNPEISETDQLPFEAKGWRTWVFPNSKAEIKLDSETVHTGKVSAMIGENQIGAAVIKDFHVRPDCRYELSLYVKASEREKISGALEVRFTGNAGWLDDGSSVRIEYPEECIGTWQKVTLRFQPLKDAINGMLLLNAPVQKNGEKIWFDDVCVNKIYDPSFFGEEKMIDAFAWSESEGLYLHPTDSSDPEILHAFEFVRKLWKERGFLVESPDKANIEVLTELKKVEKAGSFELSFRNKTLSVSGDAEGIRCGLYDALQRMGFRWFSPAEKIISPWMIRVDPATLNVKKSPVFPFRGLHICGGKMHHDPQVAQWMSFHKMNRRLCSFGEVRKQAETLKKLGLRADTTVHTYYELIPDSKYFKTHPEYFALVGGKRIPQSAGGQLCLSNVEMRKEFVKNVIRMADENPQVTELGISPNDGYGHCECENCRALDSKEDKISGKGINGRIADFISGVASEVKKQRPDIRLGHFSYSNFGRFTEYLKEPLVNTKLSVTTFRCLRHAINDPACEMNAECWARIQNAVKKSNSVSIYEYYSYLWGGMPAPFVPVIARDLKAFQEIGVSGLLSECGAMESPDWKTYGYLFSYVAESLYNGALDTDLFLKDYCDKRFPGSLASEAMFSYFKQMEKQLLAGKECFKRVPEDLPELLSAETIEICQKELAIAEKNIYRPKSSAFREEKALFEYWISLIEERPKYAVPKRIEAQSWQDFLQGNNAGAVVENTEDVLDALLDPTVTNRHSSWEQRLPFVDSISLLPDKDAPAYACVYESPTHIGFIIECEEPDMGQLRDSMNTVRNLDMGSIYHHDNIEIFLARQNDPSGKLWHFIVSADGKKVCASECRGQDWNWSWCESVSYQCESSLERDRWILRFSLPKAACGLKANDPWSFSLARNRWKPIWKISGIPAGGAFFKPENYIQVTP